MALFANTQLYRHKKAGYSRFCKDTQTLYNQIQAETASDADITNFINLVEAEERLFRLIKFIMLDFGKPVTMPPHPHAGMERIRSYFRHRLVMLDDRYRNLCPASFRRRDKLLVRNAMLEHWKRLRVDNGQPAMTPAEERMRILSLNMLTELPPSTDTEVNFGATGSELWQSMLDHIHADPYLHVGEIQADGTIREI
ncbi:hypothetical protein DIS24_g6640 [Lasiodiplodia hormozganensis]|uniref:Uncharacterized protein n=1 Tax=Lasiodiplodia hormozganensis TaxID=869390 RepID=A0AA39YDE3_9PEZI|nr:hypothetical protein DIS24_g6640 [Lasiodiplodia hormozganensis]